MVEVVELNRMEITTEPTSASVELVNSPDQLASSPVEPASSPVEPASSPVEPVSSPVEPGSLPVDPGSLPVEPGSFFVEPGSSPVKLESSPNEQASPPVKPAHSPGIFLSSSFTCPCSDYIPEEFTNCKNCIIFFVGSSFFISIYLIPIVLYATRSSAATYNNGSDFCHLNSVSLCS